MTYMNEDRQRECHKCERSYEGGKRIITKYKDKYGNTYFVHIHEGGGWGVRVEDKLRKRIRWSRAGADTKQPTRRRTRSTSTRRTGR